MKSNTLKRLLFVVAVTSAVGALSASAGPDPTSCPDRIVVRKQGPYDVYAYFHNATIYSANIPSESGAKYTCTYEGRTGMRDDNHTLNANEFIKSVLGTGWQKGGTAYTCTQGLGADCPFVIQKD